MKEILTDGGGNKTEPSMENLLSRRDNILSCRDNLFSRRDNSFTNGGKIIYRRDWYYNYSLLL